MTNQEEYFIKLYCFDKKTYPEIEKELKVSRNVVRNLFTKLQNEIKEIQKIRGKFKGQRKDDFNNDFKIFYDWYRKQENKCDYCGISQEQLNYIFIEKMLLPLNDASKRSSGALEIERKNSSSNKYTSKNMALACPLCNNAKSNLIDEGNWRKLFVSAIKQYYEGLLRGI